VEQAPIFRLIVGLGNPGRQYAGTRHNVGFLVLDELARRDTRKAFHFEPKWNAETVSTENRLLMKPQTFMNRSGDSVAPYARYHRIEPHEVLVVLDDVALPFGDLRLRKSGSAGGHNGLSSIISQLGSEIVPRLRVGIGGPPGPLTNHVLGRFSEPENQSLAPALHRAADAVSHLETQGFESAMNLYNQKNTL